MGAESGEAPDLRNARNAYYLMLRLKHGRRDLYLRVLRGELSLFAAAIEAGFCRELPLHKRGLRALRAAWRRADQEERAAFLRLVELCRFPP